MHGIPGQQRASLSETVSHQSLSGQLGRMADDLDADILADAGPKHVGDQGIAGFS
jgi:hypothetical protein